MKKRVILFFLIVLISVECYGLKKPNSFFESSEPGWATIELRENLSYEKAWQNVVDILARKFEIAVMSKDGGYIRTNWIYTWWKEGKMTPNYRVRVIIKFSPDKQNVDLKTEAQYKSSGQWLMGYDTRLLSTIKSDIMGTVGRTTR